ncbi:MAG: 50S ribosomal protein L6 [Alphaproteobacteria bacterium]|nr:50S ribosomal protein L6 [Alphaproteobacteria bacterium]
MSRVGNKAVTIPEGVTITLDGNNIKAKGKIGELDYTFTDEVKVETKDNEISVSPVSSTKKSRSLWGTTRSRISNLVTGVTEGYSKKLEIVGVGYRAAMQGKDLKLALGFSHDVLFAVPEGITIKCASPTQIEVSGICKQSVGQVAAKIRGYRPPEPYKGKGVKYADEQILRKEGKKK